MLKVVFVFLILVPAFILQFELELMNSYPAELQVPFIICFVCCSVYSGATIMFKYRWRRVSWKNKKEIVELALRLIFVPIIAEIAIITYQHMVLLPKFDLNKERFNLNHLVIFWGIPTSLLFTLAMTNFYGQRHHFGQVGEENSNDLGLKPSI